MDAKSFFSRVHGHGITPAKPAARIDAVA